MTTPEARETSVDGSDAFSWDVFLIHDSVDRVRVEELYEKLTARGLRVALDSEVVRPGERWPRLFPKVMRRSMAFVVTFSSRSGEGLYFESEIVRALDLERKKNRRVIPVLLDADASVQYGTESLQYIEAFDRAALEQAADEIAETVRSLDGADLSSPPRLSPTRPASTGTYILSAALLVTMLVALLLIATRTLAPRPNPSDPPATPTVQPTATTAGEVVSPPPVTAHLGTIDPADTRIHLCTDNTASEVRGLVRHNAVTGEFRIRVTLESIGNQSPLSVQLLWVGPEVPADQFDPDEAIDKIDLFSPGNAADLAIIVPAGAVFTDIKTVSDSEGCLVVEYLS